MSRMCCCQKQAWISAFNRTATVLNLCFDVNLIELNQWESVWGEDTEFNEADSIKDKTKSNIVALDCE